MLLFNSLFGSLNIGKLPQSLRKLPSFAGVSGIVFHGTYDRPAIYFFSPGAGLRYADKFQLVLNRVN